MYGTLGKKWSDWTEHLSRPCTECPACCVMHGDKANVTIFGQCGQCAHQNDALRVSKIDLFEAKFDENVMLRPLECSTPACKHRAIGITEIRVIFNAPGPGLLRFDIKGYCFNPGCVGDPSTVVLLKRAATVVKGTVSTRCCAKPKITIASLRPTVLHVGDRFNINIDALDLSGASQSSPLDTCLLEQLHGGLKVKRIAPIDVVFSESKGRLRCRNAAGDRQLDCLRLFVEQRGKELQSTKTLDIPVVLRQLDFK
ncbi:hypothetical protein M885DRAFT_47322 [Pelagophyceae sp. CCMP2097]|nr:hypothetical protein M885DRAFT_47322 [Pelagophyceae sp. CCMP2097]